MAVGEKTLDQFTGTGDRPTPFTLYFLRNPSLSSPQSRKQALRVLYEAVYDSLVVEDTTVSDPTALTPTNGQQWIVATGASGAWNTHDNELAIWDANAAAWVFATPDEGWRFYSKVQDQLYVYDGASWIVDRRVPSISGNGGRALRVNAGATALEFVEDPLVPALTGNGGKGLRANSGETALEFVADVIVPALTSKGDRLRVDSAGTSAEWTTGPKAGAATIADTASVESVAFATAFPNANYSISLTTADDDRVWFTNKAAGGFDINRAGSAGTLNVDWIAVPHEDL